MKRPDYETSLVGVEHKFRTSSTGSITDDWSDTGISSFSKETTVGTDRKKPDFQGFVPPTSYQLYSEKIRFPVGTCTLKHKSPSNKTFARWTGCFARGIADKPINWDTCCNQADNGIEYWKDGGLRNAALIAARNKLKSSDINLGVAFGERKQTMRLLGDTATRLYRALKSLKRGAWRDAMDHLQISAFQRNKPWGRNYPDQWLALQYGWKPLLSDVYGAAEALNGRRPGDWRVTVKAVKKRTDVGTFSITTTGASTTTLVVERSVMCRLDALPANANKIALSSLGVTNPLSVAWELVPFSFLVDWAFPLGSYLESLDALLGYTDAYSSSSLFTRSNWTVEPRDDSNSNYVYTNSFTASKEVVFLDRVALQGVPIPTFPRIKNPASLGHMANGLALLASFFGRSPPRY